MAPNTTSFISVVAPCANWTMMGLATFVITCLNRVTTLGLINKCMARKSKRHITPLVYTLNLSRIKFRPNLATFAFAINPLMPSLVLPFHNPWQSAPTLHSWNTKPWQHHVASFLPWFLCPWVGFYPTSPSCPSLGHWQFALHFQCSPLLWVVMLVTFLFFVHGVIFHALCNLHHLLACCGDLNPLQNGITTQGYKPSRKTTFYAYSSFIKMNFSKDAKVWTYFPIIISPSNWCKLKSSCPSFRIWLWGGELFI